MMCRVDGDASVGAPRPWYARKRSLSSIGLMALISSKQTGQTFAFVTTDLPVSRPMMIPVQSIDNFRTKSNPITRARIQRPKPSRGVKSTSTSARYFSLLPISALPRSWFYLFGLALQFGLQPLLTKAFTPSGIIRSTVIMAQDLARFGICCLMLVIGGSWHTSLQSWTLRAALIGAGIPSFLYMVQNYFALMAYQALPPVTFNILNQTKTLSAALCCYLILGRRQSAIQIIALFLLLMSALVIENIVPLPWTEAKGAETVETTSSSSTETTKKAGKKERTLAAGVAPILIASFISGLAGAISQKSLENMRYNAYVFSMELSFFSLVIMTTTLLLGSPDGKKLRTSGFSEGWTWKTWIPVVTNAAGGVLVGLVTQHLGAVRKGFALIFGLLLSGVLQNFILSDEGITTEQILGGVLASCSVWMHSKFPPH